MRLGGKQQSPYYDEWTAKEIYLQKLGGRRLNDIRLDERGEYVDMWDGRFHWYIKHHLPDFLEEDFIKGIEALSI